ncbi:unnamed protein product [Brachionus calyciflorus]|uniref:FGGY carbohydrate kinase domain-containing protein n=1 Tax=Brachionus calyciflorus TaxID=104777 RepID=A0A813RY46_9BILA|nr:unnamed protein product [Brachionus calyciflorus]
MKYFLGVDVGTSSVRVGLFNQNGELVNQKIEQITIYNFRPNFYEQSSNEIIDKIILCIEEILKLNPVGNDILSIGFDATCSLVVLDKNYEPLSISSSEKSDINIIMWMDHRAIEQAELINSTNYEGLKNVGGSISPEMDPPKILWLKQNSHNFEKIAHFFSLPDYLVWKFTNENIRSVCSTTCKWLYKSEVIKKEWDSNFWKSIGLDELVEKNFFKIGSQIEKPFKFCEELKITETFSKKTNLSPNVKIGVSMIDAHAGGIGAICLTYGFLEDFDEIKVDLEDILVLVSGTSSCFMATSKKPIFIKGIWGPYYEAMVPNMWLNEGGQSACGKLLDHIIESHPSYNELLIKTKETNFNSIYDFLNNFLIQLTDENNVKNVSYLTKNIHVYPDFHGNRSPLADPNMSGQIIGLNFDTSLKNLALMYLATLQSIVYQTKHIIDEMNQHGFNFKIISLIGGLIQNNLYCQIVSDVCQIPVLVQNKINTSVILGSALLGASNCEQFKNSNFEDLIKYFSQMNANALDSSLLRPNKNVQKYHELKFKVYKQMINDQKNYRSIMENF